MAKKPKNKTEILQELESIQRLLLEDGIPVLEAEISIPQEPPHQSSLFDESSVAMKADLQQDACNMPSRLTHYSPSSSATSSPLRGNGENPFLPQHIRDRLQGNPFNTTVTIPSQQRHISVPQKPAHSSSLERIINEIVADTLPRIEAKLRARLSDIAPEEIETLIKLSNEK